VRYDLFNAAVHDDPDPWFARLRAECPVHHDTGRDFYTVARTDDIFRILRHPQRWSSKFRNGLTYRFAEEGPMLLDADPPVHTWQRRLLQKAWTPRYIAMLESRAGDIVAARFDEFTGAGRGNFSELVAGYVPAAMIAELVGLPATDQGKLKAWSETKVEVTAGTPGAAAAEAVADAELQDYFSEHIAERRRAIRRGGELPGDYTTMMMEAEPDGRHLDDTQLRKVLQLLVLGGIETTALLLGNALHRVVVEPGLATRLGQRPELYATAIEETLRLDSPTLGLFRTPNEDQQLHDVRIPQDAKTMVLFAAVNRDPDLWDRPDVFDVDRDPVRLHQHAAFGHGVHLCLGAPLARLEGRVVLQAIVERLPGVRYTEPPARVPTMIFRGYNRQLVEWD
jgi:cytochrome P450